MIWTFSSGLCFCRTKLRSMGANLCNGIYWPMTFQANHHEFKYSPTWVTRLVLTDPLDTALLLVYGKVLLILELPRIPQSPYPLLVPLRFIWITPHVGISVADWQDGAAVKVVSPLSSSFAPLTAVNGADVMEGPRLSTTPEVKSSGKASEGSSFLVRWTPAVKLMDVCSFLPSQLVSLDFTPDASCLVWS